MVFSPYLRRQGFLLGVVALTAIVALGCSRTEQIHSYPAPKETKPVAKESAPAAPPGEITDRMLTAILPVGNQAYFFKVVGPVAEVNKHEKEIDSFFTKISIGDDGKAKWQLPSGWKEEAGGNAIRLATIVIPAEGKPLEITVTQLPWSGTPEGMQQNVNRWRQQLELPPIGPVQVTDNTRQIKAGDLAITVVDLRGHFGASGMAPPFAGLGAGSRSAPSNSPELPPGHPPIGPTTTSPNAEQSEPGKSTDRMLAVILPAGDRAWFFKVVGPVEAVDKRADEINQFFTSIHVAGADRPTWKVPPDWKEEPGRGMRAATLRIPDGKQPLEMSVIALPWHGTPAEVLSNINRWRGQMKLPAASESELKDFTREIKSGDATMTVVDLRGRFESGMTPPFAGAIDGHN